MVDQKLKIENNYNNDTISKKSISGRMANGEVTKVSNNPKNEQCGGK